MSEQPSDLGGRGGTTGGGRGRGRGGGRGGGRDRKRVLRHNLVGLVSGEREAIDEIYPSLGNREILHDVTSMPTTGTIIMTSAAVAAMALVAYKRWHKNKQNRSSTGEPLLPTSSNA